MKNQNCHTIICGTSKSQEGKKYYYKGVNKSRFWGTLHKAGIFPIEITGEEAQTDKLEQKGILITDLSSAKGGEEEKDKKIKAESLKNGLIQLKEIIKSKKELIRIAFVGKQAAKWFFIYFIDCINFEKNAGKKSVKKEITKKYGKLDWNLKMADNRIIEWYLLPNLQRQWKKKHWN